MYHQKEGGDEENDPLLNPAHALVGKYGKNKVMANEFVDWLIRDDGGQDVVRKFEANGMVLYTCAPTMKAEES